MLRRTAVQAAQALGLSSQQPWHTLSSGERLVQSSLGQGVGIPSWHRFVGGVRSFKTTGAQHHGGGKVTEGQECISVTYVEGGVDTIVKAPIGASLLEVAHANDVELEGACEGSLACSTCHVIVEDQNMFDVLPEACDDENDMLDLAFALTETSRLGCQVIATKDIDGIKVTIPSATRNFAVDGHKPKPH